MYLCSSTLASAGPAVRNPPGAAGAEGQPKGGPEGEGAASDGEAGQCRCVVPAQREGHYARSKQPSELRRGLTSTSVTACSVTEIVLICATSKLCKFEI